MSEKAIEELCVKYRHWIIAAVTALSRVYEESGLPQSDNAKLTLVDWAQYIHCSFNKYQAPDLNDQYYETAKMERAKLAADEFWKAYQDFNSDPDEWIAQWLRDRRHQEFQQQERMSNARYLGWLQANQPHRLPPPPAVSRLRADTPDFYPTASGSGSPTTIMETSPLYSLPEQLVNDLSDVRVSTDSRGTVASSMGMSRIDSSGSMDSKASLAETEESGFQTPATDTSQEDLSKQNEEFYRPDQVSHRDARNQILGRSPLLSYNDWSAQAKKNRPILLFDAWRNHVPVGAILDTGNDGPNAISENVVLALGFGRKIDETKRDAGQKDVNGNPVRVIGTIKLFFCFSLPGDVYTEYLPATFNVVKMDIQVLFGLPYLNKHGLVTVNEPAMMQIRPEVNETAIRNMAPLTSNRKPTAGALFLTHLTAPIKCNTYNPKEH